MIEREFTILFKSIKRYFTKDMIKLMLIPLLASFVLFYMGFFAIAGGLVDGFDAYQVQLQQETTSINLDGTTQEDKTFIEGTVTDILNYMLKHTVTSWIISTLLYGFGIVAVGYMAIFTSLLIIGFLTPRILAIIHKNDYPSLALEEGYGSVFGGVFVLLKSFFVMIFLFLLCIPLYFIPVFGILFMFAPFYYFFHKMLNYDVNSTILSKKQYGEIYYEYKDSIRIKTLLLYLVSLIPFVAFFIATFYVIYLGYSYFEILKQREVSIVKTELKKEEMQGI